MNSCRIVGVIVLLMIVASACQKASDFPREPRLEYLSFNNDPNDAVMRFKFTDGDGNVGLDPKDTLSPFHASADPVNNYHWNLWIKYYEKIDGTWYEYQSNEPTEPLYLDPNATFTRIPRLDPKGQNKSLEGEVVIDMTGWYPLGMADTVKYGVILLDRDLNQSNEAVSEEIITPQ